MKKNRTKFLRGMGSYLLVFATVVGLVVAGSLKNGDGAGTAPILSAINETSYVVSTDQYSESHVVANLSGAVNLPSAAANSENYASILVSYKMGQQSNTAVLDKPNIIDTSHLNRNVVEYTVQTGDSLGAIAERYGVSSNDIRWSNNMKTEALVAGQVLYIPPKPGILYTVKDGDSFEGLADKYGSNAEEIETYNDLEKTGLVAGQTILIPSGILPEKERPEYVPPVISRPSYISNVNSRARQNLRIISSYFYVSSPGNPGSRGQCTWYAWYWRSVNMGWEYRLPSGRIGNAGTWTSSYNPANIPALFYIDHNPRYGDVVQTSTGSPGHVGVVVGVSEGQHITIREMNFVRPYVVSEAEVPWDIAKSYNYIHQRK